MARSLRSRRGASRFVLGALLVSLACGRVDQDESDGAGTGGSQHRTGGAVGSGGYSGSGAFGATGGTVVNTGGIAEPGCVGPSGEPVPFGASVPAGDSCNVCRCVGARMLSCTQKDCSLCESLWSQRQAALEETKRCDPARSVEQCTVDVSRVVGGCRTFASPENADAWGKLKEAQAEYDANACARTISGGIVFGCPEVLSGYCSPEGRCEDFLPTDRGCEVAGVLYPIGATGIPDPFSCNTCTCKEGSLACTKMDCPKPCPPGQAYGKSCARCSPTDACLVTAFACYETCVDGCDDVGRVCLDGLCLPGFCG